MIHASVLVLPQTLGPYGYLRARLFTLSIRLFELGLNHQLLFFGTRLIFNFSQVRRIFLLLSFILPFGFVSDLLCLFLSLNNLCISLFQIIQSDLLPQGLQIAVDHDSKVDEDVQHNDRDEGPSCKGLAFCVLHVLCLASQQRKDDKDSKLICEFKTIVEIPLIWP